MAGISLMVELVFVVTCLFKRRWLDNGRCIIMVIVLYYFTLYFILIQTMIAMKVMVPFMLDMISVFAVI